ncbi:MAG: hypothetical protein IMY69_06495 [Bacteroidetes bacterium]|nr:hypothetical protein [Bacteroidota bacterium]
MIIITGSYFTDVSYHDVHCPNAEEGFDTVINFTINEFYTEKDIDEMGQAVEKIADYYACSNDNGTGGDETNGIVE